MARHYGTVKTSIWDDEEFRALSNDGQLAYLMLITQPTITSVGTLAMTLRRWAGNSAGWTIDSLSIAIHELADRLFLVVDWDREELLVRTFVRYDGGHTNPKRIPAIRSAALTVSSKLLSGVLAHELNELGVPHDITEYPIDSHSIGNPGLLDTPRVVVTKVGSTPTHNPQQESSTRPAAPAEEKESHREDVDRLCQRLANHMVSNGLKRPTITTEWRKQARLLIDRDGYDLAEIVRVLDWSQADEFWSGNIHSIGKLREKFGQLKIKAGQTKKPITDVRRFGMIG